jgi:outer membrane protein
MKTRLLLLILLVYAVSNARGQSTNAQGIDALIAEGFQNNIVLKQKQISFDVAMNGLENAKRMFLPTIGFNASYTDGLGGRNINLPLGDLLNPVYSQLNQLTSTQNFPQINNVETFFFPRKQYEARVRTSMPLYNTDIIHNKRIAAQQSEITATQIAIYKRELVKEIKQAYYNIQLAKEGVKIYASALELVLENERVINSLITNGKALPYQLKRTDAEKERLQALGREAKNNEESATRYLNFLLNRSLDTPIQVQPIQADWLASATSETLTSSAKQREEIKALNQVMAVNQSVLKMTKDFWIPKLSGFLDLGNQNVDLNINTKSNYYLFGLNVDMPIWSAGRNKLAIKKSELNLQNSALELKQTENALSLAAANATNSLKSAIDVYVASTKELQGAQAYYNVVNKGYKEGVNTFIELLDARNQLTQAQLQQNLNQFKVLNAQAALEREQGTYPLN